MIRAEVVTKARKLMALSQTRLAKSIGVSPKAIQSYEQGWRAVPNRFFSQLFVMLNEFHNHTQETQPCWRVKQCDNEHQQTCPSRQAGAGCCCWMLAANHCQMMNSNENNPVADFTSCPVIARLLHAPNETTPTV
ncbi:MAG: helix-turn-helix domain-containing protein [Kiritimatiellae bacterium]|nr:helix-turn-helix domain-containing protein [Kiritimatiellia bacterium]